MQVSVLNFHEFHSAADARGARDAIRDAPDAADGAPATSPAPPNSVRYVPTLVEQQDGAGSAPRAAGDRVCRTISV